jgi:hypothetical protein
VAGIETNRGAVKATLLFTILGPIFGAIPFVLMFLFADSKGTWGIWLFALVGGFFIGVFPALVSGLIFVCLVRKRIRSGVGRIPKIWLALYGCIAGGLASTIFMVFGSSLGLFIFIFLGAASGAACALLCKPLTLNSTGTPSGACQ